MTKEIVIKMYLEAGFTQAQAELLHDFNVSLVMAVTKIVKDNKGCSPEDIIKQYLKSIN